MKMSNELIDYNNATMIQTLKATVAQGLNEPEFRLFAEHCKSTGLNPFKKEVWAIKAGGRLQVMTGINGFLAIANNHPQFDGMEIEVDNDENPSKAICRVYRKDRRLPSEGVALMKEYRGNTPIWQKMPRVMLTKVAKSIALREAFPQELNGLYTAEEMPAEYDVPAPRQQPATQPQAAKPEVYIAETEGEPETPEGVYHYKIYPKMENFTQLKQIIKDAGGKWNAAGKCWTLQTELPELSGQQCDESGTWLNSKKKKPEPKQEPIVELIEEDISFEDDDFSF